MTNIYVDYTKRDYTSNFEHLLSILTAEVPELTDRNYSDGGQSIIRLLSRDTDMLSFYIDEAFQEGFLPTARFRQSLFNAGATVGYAPVLASAATTILRLTRKPAKTQRLQIPRFTAFKRADGLSYLARSASAVEVGIPSIDIQLIQGELQTLSLTAADFSFPDSSGKPKYNLGANIAAGTIEVTHADESIIWTQVESFWRSTSIDWHYMLELNGDTDEVWFVMGDGVQGTLLSLGAITVNYVVTSGAIGNCGIGLITDVPTGLSEFLTCSNIEIATGGASSEGVESARLSVPLVTRAQRRGLTKEDYQALVEHLPGILHCQVLDRGDSLEWPHLYVVLYIVPDGGGAIPTVLRESVLAECMSWGHLGTWTGRYIIKDATEASVDISIRIGISPGYEHEGVQNSIRLACIDFFAVENQGLALNVDFGALNIALSRVAGVSYLEFDAPLADVEIENGSIAVLGTVTITVQD